MTAETHDVTTEPGDGLTVTEALDLAARDRDVLLERLRLGPRNHVTDSGRIVHGPSLWPTKPEPTYVRPLRWAWRLLDDATGAELESGYAPTRTWAWHRADAAQKRIHDERLAALNAEADQ